MKYKIYFALNTLILPEWNIFYWEKVTKVQKQCPKSVETFYFTDINAYNNSVLLFQFLGIWLSVKHRDFLIITNLSQVPQFFILLYKGKLKRQHESATCLLCAIVLHFYVVLFWNVLKTIFNVGYTRYLIKDLLHNQSIILDWSERGK